MSDHKGPGRPSEFTLEHCEKVKACGKEGMSIEETCEEIGISVETWHDWKDKDSPRYHPEFSEAVNAHKQSSLVWWLKQGRTNLLTREFNSRLFEINMMNRHNWSKKEDGKREHSGSLPLVVIHQEAESKGK